MQPVWEQNGETVQLQLWGHGGLTDGGSPFAHFYRDLPFKGNGDPFPLLGHHKSFSCHLLPSILFQSPGSCANVFWFKEDTFFEKEVLLFLK